MAGLTKTITVKLNQSGTIGRVPVDSIIIASFVLTAGEVTIAELATNYEALIQNTDGSEDIVGLSVGEETHIRQTNTR